MTCCSAIACSCLLRRSARRSRQACRAFGVHRSTYYAWKRQVDRHGLEMLRPRERRRPQMPNQLPRMVEERVLSFSIAHPGLGPKRVSSELAREKWGGIIVSPNGVWKVLCRHGLNTRAKRLALVAGYRAPYEPPREPRPRAAHRGRAAGRAGRDRLLLRRPAARHQGRDLAADRDRHPLILCLGRAGRRQERQPHRPPDKHVCAPRRQRAESSRLAAPTPAERQRQRVQRRLQAPPSPSCKLVTPASAPAARRPTATSKRCTRRSSTSAGAPRSPATSTPASAASAASSRLPRLLQPRPRPPRPPHPRPHPRRHRLRCPQDGGQMSRTCRHISESA